MPVAPRLACSAGSARLTTLPSIKARLDPRIVAARIHGAASDEHGAAAGAERMTPPSHGCAIEAFIYLPALAVNERASSGATRNFIDAAIASRTKTVRTIS